MTKALAYVNPKRRRLMRPFYALRSRFYREFWEAASHQAGASLEELGEGFLRIRKQDATTFVRDSEVMLDDHLSLKIAGNKRLTYQLLAEQDYRPPRHLGYTLETVHEARVFLETLGGPAVVKPSGDTGAGQGITTKIRTWSDLKRASVWAAMCSNNLLIEEEVAGDSFRLLYLDGELIDAVRRDPPQVIGNNRDPIKVLIEAENERRIDGQEIIALSPLIIDDECLNHLHTTELGINDIPADGEAVQVKTVINQNSRFQNHNVMGQVHPETIALGQQIVSGFGLMLAGVDLITPDIGRPLQQASGIINEVNTTPGLHHHRLTADTGTRVDVGPRILEFIFSRQSRRVSAALSRV